MHIETQRNFRLSTTVIWLTVAAALALVAVSPSLASNIKWETEVSDDVRWLLPAGDSCLLVGTETGVYGFDQRDGEQRWRLPNLKASGSDNGLLVAGDELLALAQKGRQSYGDKWYDVGSRLFIIRVADGQTLLRTDSMDVRAVRGYFPVERAGMLMVAVESYDKAVAMLGIDMASGRIVWRNENFFGKKTKPILKNIGGRKTLNACQRPLADTDSTVITLLNEKKVRKWNIRTGELIWETEVKGGKHSLLIDGYPPMRLSQDNEAVIVPCDKAIYALAVDDGRMCWSDRAKLTGEPQQIELTSKGILVMGEWGVHDCAFLSMLDPRTGTVRWESKIKGVRGHSSCAIDSSRAILAYQHKAYAVNLADGDVERLGKEYRFGGPDFPGSVRAVEDGYVLRGEDRLLKLDRSGQEMYRVHHGLPGSDLGLLDVVVLAALAAALVALPPGGGVPIPSGDGERELTHSEMALAARDGFPRMYTDIETDSGSVPGLVEVDIRTGETVASAVLGKKASQIIVSPDGDRVFWVRNKKTLVCSPLRPGAAETIIGQPIE